MPTILGRILLPGLVQRFDLGLELLLTLAGDRAILREENTPQA
jgi:hypothetical protein